MIHVVPVDNCVAYCIVEYCMSAACCMQIVHMHVCMDYMSYVLPVLQQCEIVLETA